MIPGLNLSLKELLGKKFPKYLEMVIYPKLEEIVKNPAQVNGLSVERIDDSALNALKGRYNPHELMSQEHLKPTTPLAQIVVNEDPIKSLRKIKNKIRYAKIWNIGKKVALTAATVGLVALAFRESPGQTSSA